VSDLDALDAVTDAVESGAGLPEVVRAAARALDASLAVTDPAGATLAVAARSPADERSLLAAAKGVDSVPLRLGDTPVGTLRIRARAQPAPAVARGEHRDGTEIREGARELSLDVDHGATILVARARPQAPTEESWRGRVLALALRGARAALPAAIAAPSGRDLGAGAEILLLLPGADDALAARAADAVLREIHAGLPAATFAVGRSRIAEDPLHLHRAANEALLAANVAEGRRGVEGGEGGEVLAFEHTGAYRLLLAAMSENPAELHRFYAETVQPLVAYDSQYETELLRTLETFLDADGNVAGTAQRLFTHRHTIYYRLERIRELSGLDVASSDGREKLSLGLKAMRVLGIPANPGPASEAGAGGGRVPRGGGGRRG
jgi:hypothetical protein